MRLIDADEIRIKPEYMHDICGVAMIRVEDIARILNDMPTIQPEPQWIPCSERLPDGVTQVIIQTNGEAIHEAIYMGKDDYGHYVWRRPDNEIYWNEEVVAWQKLPDPYQEEGESE